MPLQGNSQPYVPNLSPPPVQLQDRLWVVRFTGELFTSYEDYLKRLAFYRQRTWACKFTGKQGLSYEEALASEAKSQGMLEQFPDCYEEPVTRLVHHATQKLEDLCQRILAHFKDRFVPGEEIAGLKDGVPTACRVLAPVDPGQGGGSFMDARAVSNAAAILPPDPEDEYRVEWVIPGMQVGSFGTLRRSEMTRKRPPFTRAVLKSWLPLSAEAEEIEGVKGIPCIWRANARLCERYSLPGDIPVALKERIERAQQRREQQSRRASRGDQERSMMSDPYGRATSEAGDFNDEDNYLDRAAELKAKITAYGGSPTPDVINNLLTAQLSDGRLVVPVESLDETRDRLGEKTVKRALFDALEEAGSDGLNIAALVDAVQASGVKTWDGARSANSSVAATCTHDPAFMRVGPGQFALRTFRKDTLQMTTTTSGRAHSAEYESSRSPVIDKNNFKCPKCHRTDHPENSPLVLCDGCPRSYHLSCLDLTFEELPEEDWHCPKCHDRRSNAGRRLTSLDLRRSEGYDRVPYSELEREERLLLRMVSRQERDRRKEAERTDRERERAENRFLREKAKEAARWAALHPTDDLEMLDDEEEALAAADLEAQMAAEEAARAMRRSQPQPDGTVSDNVARVQRRAEEATKRANALRLIIEGPHPVMPAVTSEGAKTALYDALAIVDFLTVFGAACEAAPLSLQEVQQAAAFPLDSAHLPHLYIALLRCVLLEAIGMEGVVRSRAKRWARVIDDATWPEVLRRYLLASRAGLPVPEDTLGEDPPTAHLSDDAACIVAAKQLAEKPYHKLSAGMHLRLLVALCNDVTDCTGLRNEMTARIDEILQIQTEFRQKQTEDRKRQREEVKQKPGEADERGVEEEAGEAIADGGEEAADALKEDSPESEDTEDEQPEPNFDLPDDLKEYTGSKRDRKELQAWKARRSEEQERLAKQKSAWDRRQKERNRKRQKREEQHRKAEAEQAGDDGGEKVDFEEEAREREAALDDAIDARAVREEPLGLDRHFRRYWWYPGEPAVIFVEEANGSALGVLEAPEEVEALMARLNQNGLREKVLYQKLSKRKDAILAALGRYAISLDVSDTPRPQPNKKVESLESNLDRATIKAASSTLDGLLDSLATIGVDPTGASVKDWKRRLKAIDSKEGLAEAVLSLEADVNGLGSGLPHGADDHSLAGRKRPQGRATPEALPGANLEGSTGAAAWLEVNGQRDPDSASPSLQQQATQEEQVNAKSEQPAKAEEQPVQPAEQAVKHEPAIGNPGLGTSVEAEGGAIVLPIADPVAHKLPFDGKPTLEANGLLAEGGVVLTHGSADLQVSASTQPIAAGTAELQQLPNGVPPASADQPLLSEDFGAEVVIGQHSTAQLVATSQQPAAAAPVAVGPKLEAGSSQADMASMGDIGNPGAADEGEAARQQRDTSIESILEEPIFEGPAYVEAHAELDASDVEGSKSRRGGTLWRSARERKVWLADARRATSALCAVPAAYAAAVLVDRAQPLLRSLQRAAHRAAQEASELEAAAAAEAAIKEKQAAKERAAAQAPALKADKPTKAAKGAKVEKGPKAAKAEKAGKLLKAESKKVLKRDAASLQPAQGEGATAAAAAPPAKKAKTAGKQKEATPAKAVEPPASAGEGPPISPPNKRVDRWISSCQTCGEEGDLLCCEAADCPVAQHLACAGLDVIPEGDWLCAAHAGHTRKPTRLRRSSAGKAGGKAPTGPTRKKAGILVQPGEPAVAIGADGPVETLAQAPLENGIGKPKAAKKRKR